MVLERPAFGGYGLRARGGCLNRLDQDIALAGHASHECLCRPPASPLLHTLVDAGLSPGF